MATNLSIDPKLIEEALELSGERTKKAAVTRALEEFMRRDTLVTTGLVLQDLLQGFFGPRARRQIIERFVALPLVVPERRDHAEAAELRNACRRKGLQLGTIDALLARLCLRHGLLLLTTDREFHRAAQVIGLRIWAEAARRH